MAKTHLPKNENRDPLTGTPGAHPLGTGVGTVTGIAAGVAGAAAIGAGAGTVAGPLGTVAGAIVGGIIGGLAGSAIAEDINPTDEVAYWRGHFGTRDYVEKGAVYAAYQPAYLLGVESFMQYGGPDFDTVEPVLQQQWHEKRGDSPLGWEKARLAMRDAYDRLHLKRDKKS